MKDYNYTLIAENIHKSFGNLKVLRGLTLKASKGDVVSIIGSSGSGKSTFLRCINFLETPDNGRVILDGEEVIVDKNKKGNHIIDTKQIQRLRSQLGMVFQSFNLWSHMTILENIIEAPVHVLGKNKKDAKDEALILMEQVGIQDKANSYPIHLSGGQQQRVAIARALVNSPSILFADEPTGNLDSQTGADVMNLFKQLHQNGQTIIIITHEEEIANQAQRVITIRDGLIETDKLV